MVIRSLVIAVFAASVIPAIPAFAQVRVGGELRIGNDRVEVPSPSGLLDRTPLTQLPPLLCDAEEVVVQTEGHPRAACIPPIPPFFGGSCFAELSVLVTRKGVPVTDLAQGPLGDAVFVRSLNARADCDPFPGAIGHTEGGAYVITVGWNFDDCVASEWHYVVTVDRCDLAGSALGVLRMGERELPGPE